MTASKSIKVLVDRRQSDQDLSQSLITTDKRKMSVLEARRALL